MNAKKKTLPHPRKAAQPAANDTPQQVAAWLKTFARAYSRKDLAAVMALVEPREPLLVLGTGLDEKNLSFAQLKRQVQRDFAQVDKVAMKFDWIAADAVADTAWFAAELTLAVTAGGIKTASPWRFTGVLVRKDGEWRLRMSHLGMVASNQPAGQSWPADAKPSAA